MMMMMMMMMNCFCGMAELQKLFSLISSWEHCQRSSPLQISDTLQAGYEAVLNLSSGLVTPWCHMHNYAEFNGDVHFFRF